MPARPPVPGVVKIVLQGTMGPYNWACVFHSQWTGATPSVAALTAFATTISGLWASDVKPYMPASTTLVSVVITDISSSTGNQGIFTGNVAGSAAGAAAPSNAAVLINYPSSFRYRGGHPRTYMPPPQITDFLNEYEISTGYVTIVDTWMTAMQGEMNGGTSGGTTLAGQCAVSYIYTPTGGAPGTPRTTPLVMPIAPGSYTVEQRIASQRRRIGRK